MPPTQFARGDVVGIEEASDAELAAGDTDDGHVLDDQRHGRGAETLRVVGDRLLPNDLPGQAVEGDELRIEGRHQDEVAGDCCPPVHRTAAKAQVVGLLVVVAPVDLAGGRVECEYAVVGRRHVHDAVVHGRRDFELLGGPGRECPGHLETGGVLGRDVVDGRMPVVGVVAAVVQPLLRIRRRTEQVLGVHRPIAVTDFLVVGPVVDDRGGHRLHRRGLRRGVSGCRVFLRRRGLLATDKHRTRRERRGHRIAHSWFLWADSPVALSLIAAGRCCVVVGHAERSRDQFVGLQPILEGGRDGEQDHFVGPRLAREILDVRLDLVRGADDLP